MMRYILYSLLLVSSLSVNAQRVRLFAGGSAYLDNDFLNSTFVEIKVGSELKINRIIKPEIELSGFLGGIEDDISRNDQGVATEIFTRAVSALNFSFCPKIYFGSTNNSVGSGHFQILPRYSISKIEARGNLFTINQSNPSSSTSEKEILTEWQHSLGIGLGIDFGISHKNYDSLSLNLYYNGVDMGNALSNLKHSGGKFATNNVLGFGINYYFSFKKRLEL